MPGGPRTLYWVGDGGTNLWNSSVWSLISGVAGVQAPPTSIDDVFFDGGSGNCTLDVNGVANTISTEDYINTLDLAGFDLIVEGSGTVTGGEIIFGSGTAVFNNGVGGITTFDGTETINAETSLVYCKKSTQFIGGGKTFYNIKIADSSINCEIGDGSSAGNFSWVNECTINGGNIIFDSTGQIQTTWLGNENTSSTPLIVVDGSTFNKKTAVPTDWLWSCIFKPQTAVTEIFIYFPSNILNCADILMVEIYSWCGKTTVTQTGDTEFDYLYIHEAEGAGIWISNGYDLSLTGTGFSGKSLRWIHGMASVFNISGSKVTHTYSISAAWGGPDKIVSDADTYLITRNGANPILIDFGNMITHISKWEVDAASTGIIQLGMALFAETSILRPGNSIIFPDSAYFETNAIDWHGAFGNLITLQGTAGGDQRWYFKCNAGLAAVTYVSVKNSNASFGSIIHSPDSSNVDSGGNTNWDFVDPLSSSSSSSSSNSSSSFSSSSCSRSSSSSSSNSNPRTLYWVGSGYDQWSGTQWSLESAGTPGESEPLCSDNVIFDGSSGDCYLTADAVCNDFDATWYQNALLYHGGYDLTVYGNIALSEFQVMDDFGGKYILCGNGTTLAGAGGIPGATPIANVQITGNITLTGGFWFGDLDLQGQLNTANYSIETHGDFTINGVFSPGVGDVQVYGNLTVSAAEQGFIHSSTGTWYLFNVNGHVFDFKDETITSIWMSFAGDYQSTEFRSTDTTPFYISGSFTTQETYTNKTINFYSGHKFRFNTVIWKEEDVGLITVRDTAGAPWYLQLDDAVNSVVHQVQASYSDASAGATVPSDNTCIDGGENINWLGMGSSSSSSCSSSSSFSLSSCSSSSLSFSSSSSSCSSSCSSSSSSSSTALGFVPYRFFF